MTRRLTLAVRLGVYLAAILIALLLIALASYATELDARRAERAEASARVGRNAAAVVEAFIADIESTSVAAAEALAVSPSLDQATTGSYLARLLAEYAALRSIFVTDPRGRVIASSATGVGVDLSARPYVVRLAAGAEKVWSGSLTGIETGEITVAFGRRIGPAGAPRGYFLLAFYPERLLGTLNIAGAPDSRITLTDERGLVLYDSMRASLGAAERDLSRNPLVARALRGETVMLLGARAPYPNEERYGILVPVERVGWVVAYTLPQAPLDAELRDRLGAQAAAVTLVFLLAGVLLGGLMTRIARPIVHLAREAGGIARGERPAIAVPASAGVEVGQLAEAMRAMSLAVGQREDELRFLAAASADLGSSLEYRETLARVARLAVVHLADWCTVDVVEDGELHRVEVAFADPAVRELAAMFATTHAPRVGETEHREARVIATGRSELVTDAGDADLETYARGDPERLRLARAIGARSHMTVPLLVRGVALGAMSFVSTRPERRYGDRDLILAEDLARRAAAAIENARLYHAVQTALRTRDEFLSSVAHELKTPLTTVKGFSQLLDRMIAEAKTEPAAFRPVLARIDLAANRMSASVDELLELTRAELGGTPELERSEVDLAALVSEAVHDHATSTRHVIRVDAPRPVLVSVDRARIERVVHNLLSNALKYTPDGGEIALVVSADDREAVLEVRDRGMGIPRADLPRIFERFHRASNVIGRIGGTGIGLTLVRQIVEQHGGSVSAESEEGRGTVFHVRLPLLPVSQGHAAA